MTGIILFGGIFLVWLYVMIKITMEDNGKK
jgi:hypothetical protein